MQHMQVKKKIDYITFFDLVLNLFNISAIKTRGKIGGEKTWNIFTSAATILILKTEAYVTPLNWIMGKSLHSYCIYIFFESVKQLC